MAISDVEFSAVIFSGIYRVGFYPYYNEKREKRGVNKRWTYFLFLTCSEILFPPFFWMGFG
jgi:hypothetical protein